MNPLELADFLLDRENEIQSLPMVTGFDGFVDEMISVVDERSSLDSFKRVETIADFGSRVSRSAGHSSLREIVIHAAEAGGCAINMGDGLAELGVPVSTFATVGNPIHPAFSDYAKKAHLVSWGNEPGRTLAYEFADGKLMHSAVSQLQSFTPESLAHYIADGHYLKACSKAKVIALTDWTLYPHMTKSWEFLLKEVYAKVSHRPHFFFDLVDPSTRSDQDILEMLSWLMRFETVGPTTLGLNQNEANILCRLNGVKTIQATTSDAARVQAAQLREKLGVNTIVIHAIQYCVATSQGGLVGEVQGPYCETPKKSTGAGDRFNAGYALGAAFDLALEDRLTLACGLSGCFVRKGNSPDLQTFAAFMREWGAEVENAK